MITNNPSICAQVGSRALARSLHALDLVLRVQSTAISPGPYPVDGFVEAAFDVTDADGTLQAMASPEAQSGVITVSSVTDTEIRGTYDLQFPKDHVAGAFVAPFCAGGNGLP